MNFVYLLTLALGLGLAACNSNDDIVCDQFGNCFDENNRIVSSPTGNGVNGVVNESLCQSNGDQCQQVNGFTGSCFFNTAGQCVAGNTTGALPGGQCIPNGFGGCLANGGFGGCIPNGFGGCLQNGGFGGCIPNGFGGCLQNGGFIGGGFGPSCLPNAFGQCIPLNGGFYPYLY